MSFCFICNAKLHRVRTQVCSSITPHTKTPYPEKIAGLMGEEFVVIVNPNDKICNKCTKHLNHLDKCHNDAKHIRIGLTNMMREKYPVLKADGDKIVNGQVMAKEQLKQGQRKAPGGLTVKVSTPVTTAAVVTPLKLLKTQQQQQQQQQQQESANEMKIYKCGFCPFQSKEQEDFQFHMLTHENKNKPKNHILNQTAAKLTPVPKKQFYRCQICSKTFNSRSSCLDHIQKEHNPSTASTSIGERKTKDSRPVNN